MYMKLVSVAVGGVIYYIVYQTVIWCGIDTDLLNRTKGGTAWYTIF